MNPDDIDVHVLKRIAAHRRFGTGTLEVARRLFILRETPKRIACEQGLNLQRVYAIRKAVLKAAAQVILPDGWEEARFIGPRALIAQLRTLHSEEIARIDTGEQRPNAAGQSTSE